jgi:vanillate O-demethylase ferredoxin subunit
MTRSDDIGLGGRREILVRLARSDMTVLVGAQETILAALRRIGVDVPTGCLTGTCGSCETRVLEGVPLHRDQIIDPKGPDRLKTMMVCCSRAATANLTLDL